MLPIEMEIPSLCVLMEVKMKEVKWVQERYEQQNLIEEIRLMPFPRPVIPEKDDEAA